MKKILVVSALLVVSLAMPGVSLAAETRTATDVERGVYFRLTNQQLTVKLLRGSVASKYVKGKRLRFICGNTKNNVSTTAHWKSIQDQIKVQMPAEILDIKTMRFCGVEQTKGGMDISYGWF